MTPITIAPLPPGSLLRRPPPPRSGRRSLAPEPGRNCIFCPSQNTLPFSHCKSKLCLGYYLEGRPPLPPLDEEPVQRAALQVRPVGEEAEGEGGKEGVVLIVPPLEGSNQELVEGLTGKADTHSKNMRFFSAQPHDLLKLAGFFSGRLHLVNDEFVMFSSAMNALSRSPKASTAKSAS